MTNREREIYDIIAADPMISQEELAEKLGITRSAAAVHISNMMKKGYIIGKGYIMHDPSYITVFGAVNMDIGGTPDKKLVKEDSNPGRVRTSLGGVGRNIAHNLSLLNNSVKLVTAFGDDDYAKQIINSCNSLKIDIHDSLISHDDVTSTYLYITREDGDMELAINDMSIYKKMTPEFIETKTNLMENSTLVAVDANLPEETIEAIVRHTTAPIFAEPVSAAKASKFKKVLKYIHTITPNIIEAEALTGMTIDIDDSKTVAAAADKLLDAGVKQVIITMGNRGVYYKSAEEEGLLQPVKAKLVNTTGAGDALFAGIATGYCKGLTLTDSVKLGMAAAAVTIETTETNNKELSYEVAINRAKIKGVK
ncbi:MAG: bifunctional hydroxymethylpyrimidine kinase/phosphomethylpyrimidine kinase [Lachnospiraceae bacterium]|nr:bifunctional hydroxymethylpyrimidine kinase/phosphomethylpyrimidine kinase [Lachnospiraceae bacterium]